VFYLQLELLYVFRPQLTHTGISRLTQTK
jgi:hypothetical protein